ncbi:hypothetical protein BLAT2472_10472 [Burkholderia latens]|nr:hypothetical protein WK25_06540 [Burkholderia latens]
MTKPIFQENDLTGIIIDQPLAIFSANFSNIPEQPALLLNRVYRFDCVGSAAAIFVYARTVF